MSKRKNSKKITTDKLKTQLKQMKFKRVIIESPYKGDIERNTHYARLCLQHSLDMGEAPIASHLLYTQILDEDVQHERMLGINAGLAWKEVAEAQVFYIDYGMSEGMKYALKYATENKIPIVYRKILE